MKTQDKANTPLVSAMMPTYNSGKFVAESIESIINQTYTNWELIIVDDGSTDNTCELIKAYEKKDDRIKCYFFEHGGRGVARNRCLKEATGKYIAVCDSDDISFPERFEKQVHFLEENQDIDVVGAQICQFQTQPVYEKKRIVFWPEKNRAIINGFKRLKMKVPNAVAMIRRYCFEQFGEYDESLNCAQDYDFFKRLWLNGASFYNLTDVLLFYRQPSEIRSLKYFLDTQIYACYVDLKNMGFVSDFNSYQEGIYVKLVGTYLFIKYYFYFVPKMKLVKAYRLFILN